jgi:hypothetical protein
MQIVESGIGTQKQLEPEVVQVTLSNAAEILAVFPQLSQFEENCREYNYSSSSYVELGNQMIVKKCKSSKSYRVPLCFCLVTSQSGQDVSIRHYMKNDKIMLQG